MSTLVGVIKRYHGEVGELTTEKGKLVVRCQVKDVRVAFGRFDFLVSPIGGSGEAWVDSSRVQFDVDSDGGRLM